MRLDREEKGVKEEGERKGERERRTEGETAKEEGRGRGGLRTSPPPPREPRGLPRWPERPAAVPFGQGPRTPDR